MTKHRRRVLFYRMPLSLAGKLAVIAAFATEYLDGSKPTVDDSQAERAVRDPEVKRWLEDMGTFR